MHQSQRPDPTRFLRLGVGVAIATVCITVIFLMVLSAFPRFVPVIIVGALGAAVLVVTYRDRFLSNCWFGRSTGSGSLFGANC